MMTHRSVGMCPSRILIAGGALLVLAIGCATSGPKSPETGGLPDEEEWAPGKKPASDAAASTAAADVPLITRKAAGRQITEEQKADFEKAVAEYAKARKAGTLPGPDCSSVGSAFRKVADQAPALFEARSNEAAVNLECGKKDEAVGIWERLSGGDKPFAPALANLGYLAWQGGDKTKAEALFKRSIQADPLVGSIAARINMAQIYRERARLASGSEKKALNDGAVKELRRVLALDGNSLQAYAGLCFIYFDLDLPEAAKLVGAQAVKRAQEIATGKFEDEGAAADESGKRGKKAKAKKEDAKDKDEDKSAQEAPAEGTGYTVEMKKAVAVVYNTLGMIYLAKKNYTDAIKNFSAAVDNDPALFEARLNLAAVSLKFRNYDIAEENLRAVLKAKPRNYEAIIGLGVALRGNRKLDEAEQKYNEARTLDPQRPDSYYNLGLLYQEYKAGSDKPMLQKAQGFYRDFLSRTTSAKGKKDAEKRIKDIDEVFVALEEAAKMMKEAEEMQRKAEEQQKKMEEEMKKMEAEEKRQQEAAKVQEEEAKAKKAAGVEKAPSDKGGSDKGAEGKGDKGDADKAAAPGSSTEPPPAAPPAPAAPAPAAAPVKPAAAPAKSAEPPSDVNSAPQKVEERKKWE